MDIHNDPVTYPPEVYDEDPSSPVSSRSDPHRLQDNDMDYTSNSKRGFHLSRSQSRMFRKSDKGRDSTGVTPSSRNTQSRNSSRSTSALLVLTTERLNNATSRAINLENQQEELVQRFGNLLKDKIDLERELDATHSNLKLHKTQLDVARREMERAEETVQELERRRSKAESESTRLRSQVRALETEKLMKQGYDEGWQIGFKEGIERAQVERGFFSRLNPRRHRHQETRAYDEEYTDDGHDDSTANGDESTVSSPRRARSNSTRSRRSEYVPEVVPPMPPLPIPDTQSQRPRTVSQGRPRSRTQSAVSRYTETRTSTPQSVVIPVRAESRTSFRRNTAPPRSGTTSPGPDRISHNSPEIIHPIPRYEAPPSPSASHRSRSTIPPDGFIPIEGENGFISLPPPHEMSVPVPPTTPTPTVNSSMLHLPPTRGNHPTPHNRAMSVTSRASTRISQYDIVSPPRGGGLLGLRVVNADPNASNNQGSGTTRNEKRSGNVVPNTPSRRVEQWRNSVSNDNDQPDRRGTPGTTSRVPTPSSVPPVAVSPTPVATSSNSFRPRTPRVSLGPRRPRDIVLPAPLAAGNMSQQQSQQHPSQQIDSGRFPDERAARSRSPLQIYSPGPSQAPPPPYQAAADQPAPAPAHGNEMYFQQPSPASQDSNEPNRPKTPRSLSAWLRSRFQRSLSSPPPNIDIEPASEPPSSGTNTTVVDPILLTPEDANRPIPLPNEIVEQSTRGIRPWSPSTPVPSTPITIHLPDNDLPLGFVPTSPEHRPMSPRDSSGHFSPIPPLPPSTPGLPSPPERPSTSTGLTRPPLATISARDKSAARALSGPAGDRPVGIPDNALASPRSRAMALDQYGGWGSPASSFLRPLESVFSEDDQ